MRGDTASTVWLEPRITAGQADADQHHSLARRDRDGRRFIRHTKTETETHRQRLRHIETETKTQTHRDRD